MTWCLRRIRHILWTDFVSVKWRGSVLHWTTILVWHYPWTSPVILQTSQSCRSQSRPFPSSSVVHSGSSQRLASQVDRDNLGWGQWRTIYDLSISAWRQQGGVHWIDRHGGYSWRRLPLLDMLERERWMTNREFLCLTDSFLLPHFCVRLVSSFIN